MCLEVFFCPERTNINSYLGFDGVYNVAEVKKENRKKSANDRMECVCTAYPYHPLVKDKSHLTLSAKMFAKKGRYHENCVTTVRLIKSTPIINGLRNR